ncbi:hypothetical protein MC885_000002, partial [Smutsia gigantea]
GKILFAQHKDAGFSFSHHVSCHWASLSIVGNCIPTPRPAVKEKALRALDNLNPRAENQGQIKMYTSEVCRETVSHCCNSFQQQARLNLLKWKQTASPGHHGLLSGHPERTGTEPTQKPFGEHTPTCAPTQRLCSGGY